MKDSKAQIEDDPEDKESEAATDDEEYVPEKIITHRADFDLVSISSRVPNLSASKVSRNQALPRVCATKPNGLAMRK